MEALQKIVPGKLYDANYDPQILEIRRQAKIKIHEINHLSPAEGEKRESMIRELFGSVGKNLVIESPFYCDYGPNIHIGDDVAINHNLVILDGAEVRIGNSVFIAPNVGLYTAGHPIDVERRSKGLEFASPIIIEDYVWIGGGVSIVPGVTVKKGSVIAAGSVVIRDIPEGVVAGGNPCKVIRKITDEDTKTTNFIKRQRSSTENCIATLKFHEFERRQHSVCCCIQKGKEDHFCRRAYFRLFGKALDILDSSSEIEVKLTSRAHSYVRRIKLYSSALR